MKMNQKETEEAKQWLGMISPYDPNDEMHPFQMNYEDTLCVINYSYPGGLKNFKKDLAMKTVKDATLYKRRYAVLKKEA